MSKTIKGISTISHGDYTKLQQCQKPSWEVPTENIQNCNNVKWEVPQFPKENIQNCNTVKNLHGKFHNFQGRSNAKYVWNLNAMAITQKIVLWPLAELKLEYHGYHTKIILKPLAELII